MNDAAYTLVWPISLKEEPWTMPTATEAVLEGRRRYPHFWGMLRWKQVSRKREEAQVCCEMEEVKPGKWACETHGTFAYARSQPTCPQYDTGAADA